MDIFLGAVIWIVIMIFLISFAVNSIGRSGQRMQNRARCSYCRARLVRSGTGYATTCKRCGRDQPWK